MHSVFHEALDQFVLVYLDDILVFSRDEEEHERHLAWVFGKLREHQLFVKKKKCEFGKPYVRYLGHVVGSGLLQADKEKVAAVKDLAAPRDIKEI